MDTPPPPRSTLGWMGGSGVPRMHPTARKDPACQPHAEATATSPEWDPAAHPGHSGTVAARRRGGSTSHPFGDGSVHRDGVPGALLDDQVHVVVLQDRNHLHLHGPPRAPATGHGWEWGGGAAPRTKTRGDVPAPRSKTGRRARSPGSRGEKTRRGGVPSPPHTLPSPAASPPARPSVEPTRDAAGTCGQPRPGPRRGPSPQRAGASRPCRCSAGRITLRGAG